MSFEREIGQVRLALTKLGLNEYQSSALAHLILLGETKATTLSRVSGVPSARIYGVLDDLVKMGLVVVRPGRPALYRPRHPREIADLLTSLRVDELRERLKLLKGYGEELADLGERIYLKGRRGLTRPPLMRIVSIGEASLKETMRLYEEADDEILILSRAMEYLPEVKSALKEAAERGVSIKIIMMDPGSLSSEDREKQGKILKIIREEFGDSVEIRFADEVPMRGCITDPGRDGGALFLVEEPGVPFFMREAAITFHPSVVRGLASMFRLIWECKSRPYEG